MIPKLAPRAGIQVFALIIFGTLTLSGMHALVRFVSHEIDPFERSRWRKSNWELILEIKRPGVPGRGAVCDAPRVGIASGPNEIGSGREVRRVRVRGDQAALRQAVRGVESGAEQSSFEWNRAPSAVRPRFRAGLSGE